jgi:aminoglycoside/choline kinase family phosphotransferase
MDSRQSELRHWAVATFCGGFAGISWEMITADASSRRYFRLGCAGRSAVCADAPPASENNDAFIAVQSLLSRAGLPVPELLATDLERGFLLLEDLGDQHLAQALDVANPAPDYLGALPLLLEIQSVDGSGLPPYDEALLSEEYSRFHEWFCSAFLELPDTIEAAEIVRELGERLVADAIAQPQVLVYRDYHCRNLLVRSTGGLGLIDFQDAVLGPLCYDLASLLRDCYLRWEPCQVRDWALWYRQRLLELGRPAGGSEAEFMRWFDWIGLHRHLKVLGNFTRLALRDGKSGYLKDIPLVVHYVREVLPHYPEFARFAAWFSGELEPRIAAVNWEGGR